MNKREEFYKRQEEVSGSIPDDLLDRAKFRMLGIEAIFECKMNYKEAHNINRLISHTLGDDYVS